VLERNGLVVPQAQRHKRMYKRWQRETPMALWRLDLVGGIYLADGRDCKMLSGIDDHSRFAAVHRPAHQAPVHACNHARPHQALDMATPASLFRPGAAQAGPPPAMPAPARAGALPTGTVIEVSRTVNADGTAGLAGRKVRPARNWPAAR
jgi:hypothetical protein